MTRARGDAYHLASQAAAADLDAVLVAGGDGTLNEALNALVGSRTALGLLPCGTANVWARQLRLPASPRALPEVARMMNEAGVRTIDVGRVTLGDGDNRAAPRHFLLWSGVGLDAHVTRSIEPRLPRFKRWGQWSYALAALRAALTYRGMQAEIEIDGQRLDERAIVIVVSNARLYAGYFHLALDARLDDGWLDVSVFRGQGFRAAATHAVRVVLRRHRRHPRVVTLRARNVRVTTRSRCDVHVDAEPIGTTPATYTIVPHALRVLVPLSAPLSLFTSREENV